MSSAYLGGTLLVVLGIILIVVFTFRTLQMASCKSLIGCSADFLTTFVFGAAAFLVLGIGIGMIVQTYIQKYLQSKAS